MDSGRLDSELSCQAFDPIRSKVVEQIGNQVLLKRFPEDHAIDRKRTTEGGELSEVSFYQKGRTPSGRGAAPRRQRSS